MAPATLGLLKIYLEQADNYKVCFDFHSFFYYNCIYCPMKKEKSAFLGNLLFNRPGVAGTFLQTPL